ncbi:MAG: outer membrane protein assembly factor BamA [Gemmatimonadales bacterium]
MRVVALSSLIAAITPAILLGQGQAPQRTVVFDSIAVEGVQRLTRETVISRAGIPLNTPVNFRDVQHAIELLYATGQVSDIQMFQTRSGGKNILLIELTERPMLARWSVTGTKALSERKVRGRVKLLEGRPYAPEIAAASRAAIDSLYKKNGYYSAQVALRTIERDDGSVAVVYDINEGQRVTLSQIVIDKNNEFSDGKIASHMTSGTEGFWFWKKGEYSEDKVDADIRTHLPEFYGGQGYVDFHVESDTLVVDRNTGKGALYLTVAEGVKYEVGSFEVRGNHHFSTEQLEQLYPFRNTKASAFSAQAIAPSHRQFDKQKWDKATDLVSQFYNNSGYIYARVTPSVIRRDTPDGHHVVDLKWDIVEGAPAIVNRVIIRGNNVTHEDVIRRAIVVVPGDLFRQDALIQSYQNLSNLGFFEQPLAAPTTTQANDQGDLDVIFTVSEKHTGNVNFGASVGQGVGVGGFIGLDEPNLLGRGKHIQFQWQFGKNVSDFNVTYTDPSLRGGLISTTLSAHRSRLRFTVADLGRINSRGVSVQFGFPILGSRNTRLQTSYSIEQSEFNSPTSSLTSRFACSNCVLSTVGVSVVRDTRIGLPFPIAGTMHQVRLTQNGGPIGGSGNFRRLTVEGRWYAPLGRIGGTGQLGSEGIQLVLGLKSQSGFVWGEIGPHFRQLFSMGGTQFGIPLRGYEEFSITPLGFDAGASSFRANTVNAFGASYFQSTAEFGMRFSGQLYLNAFMDAGNVWARPSQFNPTRLFRGAGIGISLMSPIGPIGLDYAYGFDRRDLLGNRDPAWKLHFKLGNFF